MKYVLMYTNRPDLDAAVPEERRAEVYQAIYGWFEKHGAVMADGGAELPGPGNRHVCQVRAERRRAGGRRRALLRGEGECRRVQHHRRSRPGCRHRHRQRVAVPRSCPALRWRSGRSSITAAICEPRAIDELKSRAPTRSAHVL